ncbi:MAG: leucine-rich repeat domain-containing protein, partial [Tannerellaceae bacterium]|nr:leucine-rich repeat domain-containing protein [Tannerellaceae bacterium]
VGKAAFAATAIDSVATGAALTSVGDSAFATPKLTVANFSASASLSPTKKLFGAAPVLTTLYFPTALTAIPADAFRDVTTLKAVAFPNALISIGNSAFQNCTALDTAIATAKPNLVNLKTLESIGDSAFFDCTKLALKDLEWNAAEGDQPIFALKSIGKAAFERSGLSGTISLPNRNVSIGVSAFRGTALTSVTLPAALTVIPDSAFRGCKYLAAVNVSALKKLTSIGAEAFHGTILFQESPSVLSIPSSVSTIGKGAFSGLENLREVDFSTPAAANLTLHADVFKGCSSLEKIRLLTKNVPALASGVSISSVLPSRSDASSPGKIYMSYDSDTRSKFSSTWSYVDNINWKDTAAYSVKISAPTSPITFLYGRKNPQKKVTFQFWDNYKETSYIVNTYDKSKINISKFSFPVTVNELTDAKPFEFTITPSPSPSPSANPTTGSLSIAYSGPVDEYALVPDIATIATDVHFPKITALSFTDQDGRSITENKFKKGDEFTITATVKVNNQVVNDLALALTVLDDQETYGFDHSKLFKVENTNSPLSKEITVIGYPTNGIASFFTAPITTKINDAFGAASVDTSAAIKVPTFAVTESKIIPNNKTLFLSDEDFDNGFTLFAKIMADDTPLSIADQLIVVQSDGKAVRSTPTVEEHIKENITILPGMSFQSNIIVENGTDDNNSFISINKVPQHQVASGGGFTLNWPFLSSDDFGAKDLVVAYGSSTPAHPQFEFNGLKYEVIEESPLRKVKVVPLDPTQDPTYSALSESVTIPTIVSRTVEFEDQTKQTLQYSVTEIGTSAFRNCAYINSVTLPATIQKIGKYAFYGCTSASVTFAANSTALQTIGDFAFVGTKIIGALTLSVTSIGYSAFHKTDIAHLTLTAPSDATDAAIKADAFSETKIKNLSLTGPFDVSPGAFRQTPLATLTLNGVSPIERSFADIDSLRSVTFSGKGSVASSAFANCDSLKEISFASGSDYTLFASAFSGCGALTSLAWPVTPTLDGAVESLVDIGIPSTCTIYVPYNKIDELDEAWDWPLLKPTFAIEILEPKVCQAFSGQAADLKYRILRYGFPLSTDQNDPAHGVGFNSSFGAVTVSPTAEEGTAEATLSSDELTGSGSLTSSGIGTRRLLSDLDAVAVDTFVLSLPNTSIVGDQGVLSDTFVFKVNSPVVQTFSVVNPDEHPYAVFRKDTLFLFAHEKDLPLKNTVSLFGVEVPASPSVLTEWTGETSRTETHSLSPGKGADVGKVTFSAGSPDTVSYTVTATVNDAVSQTRFTAVVLPVDTFLNGISVSALSFATVTSTQSVTLSIGKIGVAANGKDLDRTIAIDPTKWVYPTDFFTAETDGNTITLTPKRFVSKDTTFAVSSPYFAFNGSNPNFISSGKRDTFRLTLKKPVVTLDVDTLWPYDKDHTGILLGTGRHASLTLKPKISFDGVLLTVADFSKIDGLSIVNSSIVDPNHSWVHWKQVDPTSDIITYKQNEQTANVTCYPSNLGSTSVFFSLSGWTIDNSPATLINIPELDKSLRILANGLFPDDNTVTLQPFGLGSSVTLSAQTVISGIPGQVLDSKDVTWTPSGSAIVFDGNTNTVSAKPIITNLGTFNGGGSVQADYRGYLTTINFIVPAPTITLDVMPAGGTNIFDQSRPISLKKGQPLSLRAVIKTDGQPREEFTGSFPVSWTVIENGTNVSLSSEPNGRTATLTPLTTGFDEYSAKIKVAALGVEHYIDVTIQKPELDLSLNDPAPINLFLNRSTEDEVAVTLLADKQPVDDPNAVALTWSSSDENVVKITPSFTGWATQRALKAVGVGAAQITVAIPGGAETTLPVVVPPPTINLFIGAPGSPNSTTSLAVHASLTLTTSLVIDDQTIDTAAVSWIHSAPGVLLETASGKKQTAAFTPLKIDGTVSLRAKVTVEGKDYTSNVITVNVTKPAVTFDPIPQGDEPIYRTGNTVFDTLRVGQEGKVLSLNLKLNDQDPDPIVPDVVWTSFNTAAITLSPTPSKLNVPDSASLSVLKAPDADSVIVSAKVAATGDSIRFRIHVTPPDVAIALLPGFSKELQIEDTLFLKATARYGSLPLPVSAYAWTASLPNAVKILTFSDRPDSIAVVAQHAAADSVAIVALPASGGRDSFRIKVIAPSLTLSPAIPQGQSLTTLKPLDQIELAFQAATTVDPPAVSRPLSDSTHKTALWSSSDSFTVLVNKNGLITARDTGLASVSLSVAGVNVSRLVYVPLPDSMRIAVSADTNKLFIGETLQLRTSVFVNGDEINFEAFPDPALADSFAPTWKSLDTVALATVDVDENGLLSIHPNRKTGDSVKIVAAVHAFGLTVTDTFIVYPQSKLGIDVLPLPASASAFIRPDGLYLSGFDPLDFISVFSVDGQLILRARPLNGHIPHPFLPHTPYILHTSKGAFKLISLPHKND